jgi:hypothetical protein
MSTTPESNRTTPVRESINDAICRILAEPITTFQKEQKLTAYFFQREHERAEAFAILREVLGYGVLRFNARIRELLAKAEGK